MSKAIDSSDEDRLLRFRRPLDSILLNLSVKSTKVKSFATIFDRLETNSFNKIEV